jgi:uncharacterized membrane protein YpjA
MRLHTSTVLLSITPPSITTILRMIVVRIAYAMRWSWRSFHAFALFFVLAACTVILLFKI